jgi:hypothetical protein
LLVVDGVGEVNLEEVRQGVADQRKKKSRELRHQVRMPLESHVEEVKAHVVLAEDLVKDVFGVEPEAFIDQLGEHFGPLLRHVCVSQMVPDSREMRVGLTKSRRNSLLPSGSCSARSISLGISFSRAYSKATTSSKLFLMPFTTM